MCVHGMVGHGHELVVSGEEFIITGRRNARNFRFESRTCSVHVRLEQTAPLVEKLLDVRIRLRTEYLAKQGLAFLGLGIEHCGKVILRDHDDATELLRIDSQKAAHMIRNIRITRRERDTTGDVLERGLRADLAQTLAALLGAGLGRGTIHAILVPGMLENELDVGERVSRGMRRTHLARRTQLIACDTI